MAKAKLTQTQNRLRSAAAWVTTAGAVFLVLRSFGIVDAGQYDALVNAATAISGALTVFGIFNNPEKKGGF